MKLDTHALRYLTQEDWRVLTAVEAGSKNHEVVPTILISQISKLRNTSAGNRCISTLAKANLISRVKNAKYDGYRLTYGGLDYLALHNLERRKTVYSVGNQIGVGKESDIFVVADSSGVQKVLKIHRLGRISFRAVKNSRDYLRRGECGTWMYMSRLAAQKEYVFMKALHENGFPVPRPLDCVRHCIIMELLDSFTLRQCEHVNDPAKLYGDLMDLILRFASVGLIHGDFNEFNILLDEKTQKPVIIDFPQMISVQHPNAREQFDRDVECIRSFFARRYRYTSDDDGPHWSDVKVLRNLDIELEASGFSKRNFIELDKYIQETTSVIGETQEEVREQIGNNPEREYEAGLVTSAVEGEELHSPNESQAV